MAKFTREEVEAITNKLVRADLEGLDLTRAKLPGANLQGAILLRTEYNEKTIWPEGFDPEVAEAVLVEDDD